MYHNKLTFQFHCCIIVTVDCNIYLNSSSVFWTPILIGLCNIWPTQKQPCSCPTLADFEGAAAASGFLSVMNAALQRESGSDTAFNSALRAFHPPPPCPPPFSAAIQLHLSSRGDGPFYVLSPAKSSSCHLGNIKAWRWAADSKRISFLKVV